MNYKLIFKVSVVLFISAIFYIFPNHTKAANFDLIQTSGDGRVYLHENNAKRHIKDYDTFLSWGFNPGQIRQVSRAEFDSYPTAPPLTRVLNHNGRVYVVISGMKAYVTSGEALVLNGFSWADLQTFADPTFDMLPTAADLTASNVKVVHIPSLKKLYYIENGYRRWIKDWSTWENWRPYTGNFIDSESARSLVEAPPLSRVLEYNGRVFVVDNGQKRYVGTSEALILNSYSWSDLETFADPTFSNMSEGSALTSPRVVGCSSGIYLLSGGMKHHIETWDAYTALNEQYQSNAIACTLPTGPSINKLISAPDGRVYNISNNSRRYISSPGVFFGYGFNWTEVRAVGQDVIDVIPAGSDMATWTDSLSGYNIPATSGYTGKEQHIWTTRGESSDADHYAINGTAVQGESINLQNGVAGTGAFGRIDAGIEKYYITMRWNYTDWYEDTDGACNSSTDEHLDTCSRNLNSTAKNWHLGKKVLISNARTSRKIIVAVGEAGPAIWVTNERGVVSGLSPEATDYIVGDRYFNGRGTGTGGDSLEYHWLVDQSIALGPLTW